MKNGPVALAPLRDAEVFIGLVGPVGTDWQTATSCIEQSLAVFDYTTKHVRLSDIIRMYGRGVNLPAGRASEDARLERYMRAGDRLRRTASDSSILAQLSIRLIEEHRFSENRHVRPRAWRYFKPLSRGAYVLNSLKHPDEIDFLRRVYGDLFFVVSLYSPRDSRVNRLAKIIAQSKQITDPSSCRADAERLIEMDASAGDNEYGQSVRNAFPKADVFVEVSDAASTYRQLNRFFEVIFGHPFHTPTRSEYAMFLARGAALRSADLARQVGAVVMNDMGELIGAGCNDVPMAGGGVVWVDDPLGADLRDYRIGYDSNAMKKHEILEEIFSALKEEKWLTTNIRARGVQRLAHAALHGPSRRGRSVGMLEGTRVDNVIEYGRIVHAEMNALMEALRKGISVRNTDLYCTTFPCHMCARHIISAGIRRVVYIEPYPKSLVGELYGREVAIEPTFEDASVVQFVPFIGIAPRRYEQLFSLPRRKDSLGRAVRWEPRTGQLRSTPVSWSYIDNEAEVIYHALRIIS
ncbi:hypothetical protein FHP25_15470 [Vineibacter terrae]|uniref:CMP/dCMP-type deaminase domain-containing protein n=1 Tax=Vineibacter terrae TaxID=2586908 RepID=A0A5C8PM44_9HYPH|nr:anti-phage dCTP deaminase [Vineibacter terrae]TXL74812.1 hypothetical protein FHP25_15470 [Vineibacter terrae]